MKFPAFFAPLLLCLFFHPSCKDCDNGFVRKKGDCICPEGNYIIGENCVALEEGQFYLNSADCAFPDTLLVGIRESRDTLFGTPISIWLISGAKNGSSITVGLKRIDLPDGDSIESYNPIWQYTLADTVYGLYISGKYLSENRIRGKAIYKNRLDSTRVLPACSIELIR